MDQPVMSLGSISNRERAVLATSDGVLAATNQLDTAKELSRKTKEARQARTSDARVARAAQEVAEERDDDESHQKSELIWRKEALRSVANRQKDHLWSTQEYSRYPILSVRFWETFEMPDPM